MAFGIAIVLASLAGIVYGINIKSKGLAMVSVLALVAAIAVWIYFYLNPY